MNHENHMVLPWADDEPLPEHEEQDADEAYDEQRQHELDQTWYDLKEIEAEQKGERNETE